MLSYELRETPHLIVREFSTVEDVPLRMFKPACFVEPVVIQESQEPVFV